MHREFQNFFAQFALAEAHGFDWVAFGEEHMTPYGLVPNANLVAAKLSEVTKRAKIAVLGNPLPLLNPLRVAEELAWLDVVTGGRIVAGLVRGVPQNYFAYNVDPNESWERFTEGLSLVTKAWMSSEPFDWDSKHYAFPGVSLWPNVLQTPHPPIVMSAGSERAATLAAKYRAIAGAVYLRGPEALGRVRRAFDVYRTVASEDGWSPDSGHLLVGVQASISESDAEAQDLMEPALDYFLNTLSGSFEKEKRRIFAESSYIQPEGVQPTASSPPAERFSLSSCIEHGTVVCGSVKTAEDQIHRIVAETGAGIISLHLQVGNMEHVPISTALELVGEKIIPRLRGLR